MAQGDNSKKLIDLLGKSVTSSDSDDSDSKDSESEISNENNCSKPSEKT